MNTLTRSRAQKRAEFAALRRQSDHLRKQSRQMAAEAQNLRRKSRQLVKEWRHAVAKTRELNMARDGRIQHPQTASPTVIAHQKPIVATARRVPWRRVQMHDIDGPVKVWLSPEFQEEI